MWSRRLFCKAGSLGAACFFLDSAQGQTPPTEIVPTSESAPRAIRFVCYNVHNYRLAPHVDATGGGRTTAKSEREIIALLRVLEQLNPDILGITEMGGDSDLADLQQRLAGRGIELPFSEIVHGQDPARHLALLSRFPIKQRLSLRRPRYLMDDVEQVLHRGILDVVVPLGSDLELRLLGAHLKSQREIPEADQAMMRRNEAHLLRKHINGIYKAEPKTHLLLFGDFNETKDKPGLREIAGESALEQSLQDIPVADKLGHRWTYHYEPADEYNRIDYIFASPNVIQGADMGASGIYGEKDWKEASDHRPLFVTLRPAWIRDPKNKRQPTAPKKP